MSKDFDEAFDILIPIEGEETNDPRDPGGRTKYGLSERAHPELWVNGPPTLDVARGAYETIYWYPAQCDKLPWPLSYFVFDAAVNQGADTARRLLQKSLGVVQDGIIGNNTLMTVKKQWAADPNEVCSVFLADRGLRYTGTRNFDVYGRGWLKRLFKITMEVAHGP